MTGRRSQSYCLQCCILLHKNLCWVKNDVKVRDNIQDYFFVPLPLNERMLHTSVYIHITTNELIKVVWFTCCGAEEDMFRLLSLSCIQLWTRCSQPAWLDLRWSSACRSPWHGETDSASYRHFKRWARVSLPLFPPFLQEYPQSEAFKGFPWVCESDGCVTAGGQRGAEVPMGPSLEHLPSPMAFAAPAVLPTVTPPSHPNSAKNGFLLWARKDLLKFSTVIFG